MARDTSLLVKRKKEDVFCMGYFLDTVTEFSPDVGTTPQNYPVFGSDDNMVGLSVDTGALSMSFLAKDERNNIFLDLITNQDPGTSTFRVYNWARATTPVSIWVNRKDNNNSEYKGGIFFKNFQPDPGLPAGAPSDDTVRTFAGNCTAPTEIVSGGIFGEMLTLDLTSNFEATLANTPLHIKNGISGLQFIAVEDDTVTNWVTEDVELTASQFGGTGTTVSGQYILSGLTNLTSFTKVYAIYPIAGTGIYPNSPYTSSSLKYRS